MKSEDDSTVRFRPGKVSADLSELAGPDCLEDYTDVFNSSSLSENFIPTSVHDVSVSAAEEKYVPGRTYHAAPVDSVTGTKPAVVTRQPDELINLSFSSFFWEELTRNYSLANAEDRYMEKRKKVYTFIKIPRELERFLFYGFLQCLDAFLYIFTFLPLRFLFAVVHILLSPIMGPLHPSEKCDLLKVVILFFASLATHFVDTSVLYHMVRGQAIIKLYIFYNMLEVADKLFSSFGQDILDALFWTASEQHVRKWRMTFVGHLALAICYVIMHTVLVLLQATTLNVAFNSHNKALLTIMLSNNFVELKGSVFKKFAKNNLFQMSCSDARERFHYCVLLLVVVIRNMREYSWKVEHLWEMLPDLFMVLVGEVIVDWVKHAFITKFNEIPHEVYKDFTITIAYDAANSRRSSAFSDHSDQVARRMGFLPLPLTVLLIRIITQSVDLYTWTALLAVLLGFGVLMLCKVFNSYFMLTKACKYIKTYESAQKQAEALERLRRRKKASSAPASPRLSIVDFTDVMQQSIANIKGYTFSDILQHAAELAQLQLSENPLSSSLNNIADESIRLQRSKSVADMDTRRLKKKTFKDSLEPVCEKDVDKSTDMSVETGVKRGRMKSEFESLASVDRYTLCNNDRIES